MIRDRGIVVAPEGDAVRGVVYSSLLGRTRIERRESAASVEALLAAFPADLPITLMLPGHLFMVRSVTLPFTDPAMVRKALPFEIDGTVPLPVDELMVDGVPAGGTGGARSVMAIAIPKAIVADAMRLFPERRRPVRLIPDFLALLALDRTIAGQTGAHGIVNVESDASSLVLVAGGQPLAMRSIDASSDPASIAAWVETTMQPIERDGHELEALYVTGAAARSASPLLERVATVSPLAPAVSGVGRHDWPAWSKLAGAAVSAVAFPRFNILATGHEPGGVAKLARTVAIGTAVLLALGTVDLYVRYVTASRAVESLKETSRRTFLSVMPEVRNVVKEDAQLTVALGAAKETRDALIGRRSPSYAAVSSALARLAAGHPELRLRETAIEGARVTIVGDGRGLGADGLKKIFAAVGGAHAVQVEELVQGVEPNSQRFRVSVEVK